jgi:dienelactone hydrolase
VTAMIAAAFFLATATISAPEPAHVSFPTEDGGVVFADVYGTGTNGLVLAHGARFDKESWADQARVFAGSGYRVLALDFRGYGKSHGPGDEDPMSAPLHNDILAAVRHLRAAGARTVAIVGASMGGNAAADASVRAKPDEIASLVLLGSRAGSSPEKIPCRTLVIATKDDADGTGTLRLPNIQASYDKMTAPKRILILDGSAHAQFLFATDQGARVLRDIRRFLAYS